MKKIFFVLMLIGFAFHSQAAVKAATGTIKNDTAKIVNDPKVAKLNDKLLKLKTDSAEYQNKIPADQKNLQDALSKAHDSQEESKKASNKAVGGSVSDAKKAEKAASQASDDTKDANDAQKQLDKDQKKVKSITKDIEKLQKKINDLQTAG